MPSNMFKTEKQHDKAEVINAIQGIKIAATFLPVMINLVSNYDELYLQMKSQLKLMKIIYRDLDKTTDALNTVILKNPTLGLQIMSECPELLNLSTEELKARIKSTEKEIKDWDKLIKQGIFSFIAKTITSSAPVLAEYLQWWSKCLERLLKLNTDIPAEQLFKTNILIMPLFANDAVSCSDPQKIKAIYTKMCLSEAKIRQQLATIGITDEDYIVEALELRQQFNNDIFPKLWLTMESITRFFCNKAILGKTQISFDNVDAWSPAFNQEKYQQVLAMLNSSSSKTNSKEDNSNIFQQFAKIAEALDEEFIDLPDLEPATEEDFKQTTPSL